MLNTAPRIHIGGHDDYIDAYLQAGVLVFDVVGAATVAQARQALTIGLREGWMCTAMPTLVDISRFTGSIDWPQLRGISQMADWGAGERHTLPVAYVSRDGLFTMILKLVQAIFPQFRHRAFERRDAALDWLQRQLAALRSDPALHEEMPAR